MNSTITHYYKGSLLLIIIFLGIHLFCADTGLINTDENSVAINYASLSTERPDSPETFDTTRFAKVDTVEPGDTVFFIGQISNHYDEVDKLWYFGDGYSSTEAYDFHIYKRQGHYTATFLIMDDLGNSLLDSVSIIVNSPPRIQSAICSADTGAIDTGAQEISFMWDVSDADKGDSVQFSLYLSTDSALSTLHEHSLTSSSYEWKADFETSGTYWWAIIATDTYGQSDTSILSPIVIAATEAVPSLITGIAVSKSDLDLTELIVSIYDNNHLDTTLTPESNGRFSFETIKSFQNVTISASHPALSEYHSQDLTIGIGTGDTIELDTLFIGDTTPPAIKSISLQPTPAIRRPAISLTFMENGSGIDTATFSCSIDSGILTTLNGDGETYLEFIPVMVLRDGSYEARLRGSDFEGNSFDTTFAFTLDLFTLSLSVSDSHTAGDTLNIFSRVFRAQGYPVSVTLSVGTVDTITDSISIEEDSTVFLHPLTVEDTGNMTIWVTARDSAGNRDQDSLTVYLSPAPTVADTPFSVLSCASDTVINKGGTINAYIRGSGSVDGLQAFIDTNNTGLWNPLPFTGSDIVYAIPTNEESDWDSVFIKIVQSDESIARCRFAVDIRPAPLEISSIDSTDTTITIHFDGSHESDFSHYRIYRSTIDDVDTTSQLWAEVSDSAIHSYTTPIPSYAWQPRYYRIYQYDTEGLVSKGSSVQYGNITATPPIAPVLTYPAQSGQSISSQATITWERAIAYHGPVKYRVLLSKDQGEFVELTTGLTTREFQLTGLEGEAFSATIRIIAYDIPGNESFTEVQDIVIASPAP